VLGGSKVPERATCMLTYQTEPLSALYGPLIPHLLLASVHHMVVNAFKDAIRLEFLYPGQELEFKFQYR
jgi:hypothetical protein